MNPLHQQRAFIRLRKGFRWSSDSSSIAFWQIDQTGVRVVNLINNTDHLYPQLIPIPYPKAGEQNPSCRVGIVNVNDAIAKRGGSDVPEVQWISIPGDPRYHYIAR